MRSNGGCTWRQRLRQVLFAPRFGLGPPLWVDDPGFDIGEHVRTRPVPAPGDEASLLRECARLNEPPFGRSRPLWEMWFLTGLADGTVALLIRLHHVVADGLAALAMFGALLDSQPGAQSPRQQPWVPRPQPGPRELFADNAGRRVQAARRACAGLAHPGRARELLAVRGRQLRQILREGRAPRLSLNQPTGQHRSMVLLRADLQAAKAVAHAHGAKVK